MRWRNLFVLVLSILAGCSMAADEKKIYGYVEKATLIDKNMTLSAKLDTGAKSASLSAIDIHEVEKTANPICALKFPAKRVKSNLPANTWVKLE